MVGWFYNRPGRKGEKKMSCPNCMLLQEKIKELEVNWRRTVDQLIEAQDEKESFLQMLLAAAKKNPNFTVREDEDGIIHVVGPQS
jgi:hypothetical protein